MKLTYRPEIDGLRAIAVVSVILFHAGFETLSGGFTGVDVFFVISGFLITSIILREISKDSFSLISFYERRARRIMPMLFLIMAITFPFVWFTYLPNEAKQFSDSMMAVTTFCSNLLFWQETGYWDRASELKPLLHTWSLAVEEQYYLFFPLILMWLKNWNPRRLFLLISILAIGSLALSQLATTFNPTGNFFLLPTRFWELAIGALIGMMFSFFPSLVEQLRSKQSIKEWMSVIGLTMILAAVFAFDQDTPFPSVYGLLPTIGCGLIILFCDLSTWTGKLLGSKGFVQIGLISYSAYLWHQPILAIAQYNAFPHLTLWVKTGLCLLVLPLSYLSWKFVETPFRSKQAYSRQAIFSLTLMGSLVAIFVGAYGHFTDGFANRPNIESLRVANYEPDNPKLRKVAWADLEALAHNPLYTVEENPFDQTLWFDSSDSRLKMLVVGNSHGKDMYSILQMSQTVSEDFQIARFGVQIRALKHKSHPFFESPNYQLADVVFISSAYSKADITAFQKCVKHILNDGKQVVIARKIFKYPDTGVQTLADHKIRQAIKAANDPKALDFAKVARETGEEYYQIYSNQITRFRPSDAKIDSIHQMHPSVIVVDRMKLLVDPEEKILHVMSDRLDKYLSDHSHFTKAGYQFQGQRIDELDWLSALTSSSVKDTLESVISTEP
ncbi:acyltransferase [Pontibacter sp. G13]|uniref:acyltransferase family protein n=1 Tax=Pontibacter sp. G13 TaxID=3074898 RepID=UPI00288A4AC8|nr:acyltransferase [Pontibacter sp. G13]WNJ19635.1 acyltransferase [Pontibacter sp. G13]